MLVNLNAVLPAAKKGGYAVGLFNTVNLEMAKGVISAAEALRSPVIIGTAEILLPYASLEELAYFLVPLAQKASVPVVLHYDHGLTLEKIHEAMRLGFSSVMYDCSTLNFEENCKAVKSLVQEAHAKNITVEAELGHVGANAAGGEVVSEDKSIYTDPGEAKRFYEATQVDALAVAIGTAHGAYKSAPKLELERLKNIAGQVPIPLVLHGGSGLSEKDFQHAIQNGIAKVNIFTDINYAGARAAHDHWSEEAGLTDLIPNVTEAVRRATMEKMRVFGSDGRI